MYTAHSHHSSLYLDIFPSIGNCHVLHTGVVATLLANPIRCISSRGIWSLLSSGDCDFRLGFRVAGRSGLNHTTPAVKLPNKSSELIVCFGVGDTMNKDRSQGPFKHKDQQQVLFHQV